MKSTGIVRHIDELGRIVLPKELRNKFNLRYRDGLEIFIKDDFIILKKCESTDIFNGDAKDLIEYEGKKVSIQSLKNLIEIAKKNGYNI
ncbi:AbrB/MazE/SpoVT family DNA-binding domain-containing protein [[Clostridium] colinum]|uniref:AbrB/MazE/SpoVT family DNA-binding domain-containing protein n=1 Tax=[Clostridium] colinum TaxID=36835 RepID=UPI002025B110|nr:AbrB/MazE/SpoVT family DNA-binding domain-containing protein [[Clostridium] colinum]